MLIGINHRTASLDVREKLWFSDTELPAALARLKGEFSECFLVSTCNRTELYGIPLDGKAGDTPAARAEAAARELVNLKAASGVVRPHHLYRLFGCRAAAHLFKVAGGIDSMVIGDIQILGQVKNHYTLAVAEHVTGAFLNRLVQTALRVGKRVRTETTISKGAVSVSYAAVELASKIFSNLSEKRVLLIGAGETGELTAKNLLGRGVGSIVIANRTRAKSEELVASLGGTVADFDRVEEHLADVDVVISSVSSPDYVLTTDQLRRAMRARMHAPLLIIDIGVPRNVDPSAHKLENVFLHDMDSLSRIVEENLRRRMDDIPAVNTIILEELLGMRRWFESLQVNPTITDLRQYFENVRQEEVRKHINRFTEPDRELVEFLTRRIVNKLLHLPATNLKNGDSAEERHRMIDAIRGLFGLETDEAPDTKTDSEEIE